MYDSIIIGGGIAGLYFAYKTLKSEPSKKILLLESSDHLGGRAGNVLFYGQSIAIGAGIGRMKKDKLLLKLIKELDIPFYEFTTSSQYSSKIQPPCKLKDMFLYLKKTYELEKDKDKTFKTYARPLLEKKYGKNSYKNFVICSSYSDYENESAHDVLNYYEFDDNYSSWNGFSFSWNILVKKLFEKIGSKNIKKKSHVNSIKKLSDAKYEVLCSNNKKYFSNKVILATTIESVKKLLPKMKIYNQIKGQHFLRVYGKFSNHSLEIMKEKCSKTTIVPGIIHRVIPINKEKGIYMIAYTDNKDAKRLSKYHKNTIKNRNILCRLLERALDIPKNMLQLDDMINFYWHIGTHYYKPLKGNYKNRREFCYIAQRPDKNIRVIGEMISMKQGWTEGALESVESVI
jgi:hypothetical protein